MPSLQPRVASLKNYVRGRTWLATPFVSEKLAQLMTRSPESEDCMEHLSSFVQAKHQLTSSTDKFTEEDWKLFEDPEFYRAFRHELEDELNVRIALSRSVLHLANLSATLDRINVLRNAPKFACCSRVSFVFSRTLTPS